MSSAESRKERKKREKKDRKERKEREKAEKLAQMMKKRDDEEKELYEPKVGLFWIAIISRFQNEFLI